MGDLFAMGCLLVSSVAATTGALKPASGSWRSAHPDPEAPLSSSLELDG